MSAVTKLAGFAISSISIALLFKQLNLEGWETSAFIGGAVLFVVLAIVLGGVFKIDILPALLVSSLLTAFIFVFISTSFAIIMGMIAALIFLILVLVEG